VADREPGEPEGKFFLERALKALHESVTRAGPVAAASYTLLGAIILFGGIGYALDQWRGTSPGFLLAGLLLGIVVGFYELAKAAWPRR
jgi:F0F1-type ATP synthase assembly protein I